jgi:hypothetical protein
MSDLVAISPPTTQQVRISAPQAASLDARVVRFVDPAGDPVDISAWTFRITIRREHDGEILIDCTQQNGRIVVNNSVSSVNIVIGTGLLAPLGVGRFRLDLQVTRPNVVTDWYPVAGYLTLTPQITRP